MLKYTPFYAISLCLSALLATSSAQAQSETSRWDAIVEQAKGQTVYWSAWGGAENVNEYIQWIASRVDSQYDIELKHLKVVEIANTANRIMAEKQANNNAQGSVDLVWINGENFRFMKQNGLLYGPFAEQLPNYINHVNPSARQSLTQDFGTAVEGMEAPWGMAQLTFMYDSARLENPPKSAHDMLRYAKQHPGQITYPRPPHYLGTTFLKQALYELSEDRLALLNPVSEANFDQATKPLWALLDQLHPYAWRQGRVFPATAEEMMQLLADKQIDIALSFDISAASVQIERGNLPDTVRTYVFDAGTIGNTHFVAIPFNSGAKAGAQVVANYLLSPEAQIFKQDPMIWGDLSVLDYNKLSPQSQAELDNLPRGLATLSIEELGTTLPEPHSSWMTALEQAWQARYAR
ncbi:ABC transporter substrate-binding protein [Marinomonas ostreistagni]|uniref:ABC transporter substrate-binding protein n=1 Tax=Marinomonas ostreistagni TaxID=359209 RepID=UPI00194E2B3E|nr:ABC transporter substrate-binding protein [Marinomonas ostreistagni]MBM6550044.1 ABC transporter substrate-binding protein [Marinomonas ostreistagni]